MTVNLTTKLREIVQRLRATIDRRARDRDFDDELASHLEAATADYVRHGLTPAEASRRARIDLGGVTLAREQHRDARGIGFFDTLTRDVLYAFRTFRRAPLAALTIVATVGLGLGLVAVVFTLYNTLLLRADAVRRPNELFQVTMDRWTGPDTEEPVTLARPDYEAMRRDANVFTDVVAMRDPVGPAYVDGRFARFMLVSGNFFQALGVQAVLGRPLLPDDDERSAGRPVIVLSHTGWHKLFQGDPGVIGRRVVINGVPYEIVGVMPDGFRGLILTPPDYWAPLAIAAPPPAAATAAADKPEAIEVIGRLTPGLSRDAAAAALSAWASGRVELKTPPGRPMKVWLTPRQGTLRSEGFAILFVPLFFAFGLILLIGCANVANLLLARGVSRQREIGIRLSLGASRARVIRQLLTESLILSLAAALCSVLVARLFLDGTLYAVLSTLPPEFAQIVSVFNLAAPTSDWRVMVFLVVGAIVSTAFFGLAPALQATRVDLVPTIRGDVIQGARPRRARHALIAVQVGASALLLICAGVFLRGAVTASTRDPGIRTSDTLRILNANGPRRAALIQALTSDPLVAKIASHRTRRGTISLAGPAGTAGPSVLPVSHEMVSSDYLEMLGIDVVHGRGFRTTERGTEAGVVILSEITARQLWPNGDGIGQTVGLERSSSPGDAGLKSSSPFTVVGIFRDTSRASASDEEMSRSVYLPAAVDSPGHALVLRVRGDAEQVRQTLVERLARIDPTPILILTYRSMTRMQTYLLEMGFGIALVLGGLALALTVSGVFSVLSYVVEQQTKEIGVRMALGAGAINVVRLILFQSVRPVGLGLVAGGGLAAAVATVLMSTSIAAEISSDINVFDPVAYAGTVLVIVLSCALAVSVPAFRAARIDPMTTLRKD